MPRYGTRVTAVLTLLAIAAVATVATAAWLASGAGEGYAEAGTAEALGYASATPTATLYPGATGDVVVKITNPNPYPVNVTDVALRTAEGAAITSDKDGCAGSNVVFTAQTGLEIVVDAGDNAGVEATIEGAVSMVADAHNACQGARFTIPVTFSGTSAAS